MRKLVFTLALLLPLCAGAQTRMESAVRASAGVSWKITKGLHLNVEEEVRMNGVFSSLDRIQTTVSVDYKAAPFLKLGAGYVFINPFDAENLVFNAPRHRVFAEGTLHFSVNYFSFSLKERFQYTHRTGTFNPYQSTPNALALKSRIGVEYKGWRIMEPGLFLEVRTALNDPWGTISGSLQTNNAGKSYYDYTHTGYTHLYNDRYRFILRTDLKLAPQHILRPYANIDICSPYEIDTNSEGTRLFSAQYNNYVNLIIGIGYTFKF